jgi:hypothetical protein
MDFENLFQNENESDENRATEQDGGMQELAIRAPPEVELDTLAQKLGRIDGVEVDLRQPDADPADGPGAEQQAVQQQSHAGGAGMTVSDLADSMTFGRRGSAAASRTARQLDEAGSGR